MSRVDDALTRDWFYEFDFPDGRTTTPNVPADTATIHTARLAMLLRALERSFGSDWSDPRAHEPPVPGRDAARAQCQRQAGQPRGKHWFLMSAVGFDRVEVVVPDASNEQLAWGKRAMVAGWVDG